MPTPTPLYFTRKSEPEAAPVEAIQLSWRNWGRIDDMFDWLGAAVGNPPRVVSTYSETCGEGSPEDPAYLEFTMDGVVVQHGDWIVLGDPATAMKPDAFESTYSPKPSMTTEAPL